MGFPHDGEKFKEGQSGNPSGRPKGSRNRSTVAREMLDLIIKDVDPLTVIGKGDVAEIAAALGLSEEETQLIESNAEEFITLAMIAQAKAGDVAAYKALMDSAYGTPKQTLEQIDSRAEPPEIVFTKPKDPESKEEEPSE